MAQLILLFILLILVWVFVVLPQQRRVRAHRAYVAQLEVGDQVVTTAGVYGTVTWVEPDIVGLQIAPDVEITVARLAIGRPQPTAPAAPATPDQNQIGNGSERDPVDADRAAEPTDEPNE